MHFRKRALVVAGVIAAVVAALLWWQTRGDQTPDEASAHGSADATSPGSREGARRGGHLEPVARDLAGTVELDGKPVAGATVRLASAWTSSGTGPNVETDADGHFDLGPQIAATYVVIAEAKGATGTTARVDLRDPGVASDRLELLLHACTAAIHGKVSDAHGGGLAAAQVIATSDFDLPGVQTEAKADGSYELCIEPGDARIVVSADGYAELATRVAAYGRVQADFALTPEAIVLGRVVRAETGAPIAGARVELASSDWLAGDRGRVRRVESDAAGNFHFERLQPGAHEITASADGLVTARPRYVLAEIGAVPEPVVCPLGEARTFTATVTEKAGGKPVAGVRVGLVSRRGGGVGGREATSISQSDGTLSITGLAPDSYEVYVVDYALSGTTPLVADLRDADARIAIEVERLASISGRVLRAGKPVDGVSVQARGPAPGHAVTDAGGRYTVAGLNPGTYSLYAETARDGAFTNGPSISVARGEAKQGVDVVLDLSGSIAGLVVDQADRPVAGVKLRFSLVHGDDFGNATTGDDGSFTARALSGGGSYVYEVTTQDGSQTLRAADGKRFPAIAVSDGNTHVTNVRIKVRFERMAIAGHVLDAAGAPVADVTVRLAEEGNYWRGAAASSTTDVAGAFALKDLGPGTYDLMAVTATGVEIARKIDAGRSDVVIRLPSLGAIEGKLVGFASDADVYAIRRDGGPGHTYRADVTGATFRISRVPEGQYLIVARSRTGSADTTVDVAGNAIAKTTIQARGFGVLDVHVSDAATHAPIAGAGCYATGADALAATDDSGHARLENVRSGEIDIECSGSAGFATTTATIGAGETARVEVTMQRRAPRPTGDVGMVLEDQLGEVMVARVTPGGPASRAGIAVSDIIKNVDGLGRHLDAYSVLRRLQLEPGETVKLTLERDGNSVDVSLVIGTATPP